MKHSFVWHLSVALVTLIIKELEHKEKYMSGFKLPDVAMGFCTGALAMFLFFEYSSISPLNTLRNAFDEKLTAERDIRIIDDAVGDYKTLTQKKECPTVELLISDGFLTIDPHFSSTLIGKPNVYTIRERNGQCLGVLKVEQ